MIGGVIVFHKIEETFEVIFFRENIGWHVVDLMATSTFICRIRDLNDEINKLIREKGHWERRIVELGGPDYSKTGPKVTDSEGKTLAEATGRGPGYRYFGAAKNLPGVKELFEKDAPRQVHFHASTAVLSQSLSQVILACDLNRLVGVRLYHHPCSVATFWYCWPSSSGTSVCTR